MYSDLSSRSSRACEIPEGTRYRHAFPHCCCLQHSAACHCRPWVHLRRECDHKDVSDAELSVCGEGKLVAGEHGGHWALGADEEVGDAHWDKLGEQLEHWWYHCSFDAPPFFCLDFESDVQRIGTKLSNGVFDPI